MTFKVPLQLNNSIIHDLYGLCHAYVGKALRISVDRLDKIRLSTGWWIHIIDFFIHGSLQNSVANDN